MNLADASTKELVEELRRREGVETCVVEPEWKVEVAVQTTEVWPTYSQRSGFKYLEGGMHNVNSGPVIILVVVD